MYTLVLVLSLYFACVHSRMLLGSSEDRRTFYHSIRDIILVEDVDLATGFKYGECSHLVKGRVIRVSFFAGRFYPHYEVTDGDVGYLSDEAAYKACIEDYKNLKIDVLYDIGLTALALADFAKELGMTHDLNAVPALEFVINIAKRNIDRSDGRRLAFANPKFVDENLKYGTGNSQDVRFGRPVEIFYREPKDFINRPVEDIYFGPKDFKNEKERVGTPADRPSGNYFAEVRMPQRERVEAGGRDLQRDRVEAGGRDLQQNRVEAGGRDLQRDRVEAGGRDLQRDRVEAGGRDLQQNRVEAGGRDLQRDRVEAGGRDSQRDRVEAGGRDSPRDRVEAGGRDSQRDRVETVGRDSQRDRVEAGGQNSQREASVRPAGPQEPERDFVPTKSDEHYLQKEKTDQHYLLKESDGHYLLKN